MAAASPTEWLKFFKTFALIRFSLTSKGPQQPEMVVELFFAYLAAVRASSVNESALSKRQQLRLVMFDYQTKPTSMFDLGKAWQALLQKGILLTGMSLLTF